MKYTLFTICTLFNLKKLKHFLNITEYKIILLKSFLIAYLFLLLIYSAISYYLITNLCLWLIFPRRIHQSFKSHRMCTTSEDLRMVWNQDELSCSSKKFNLKVMFIEVSSWSQLCVPLPLLCLVNYTNYVLFGTTHI